MATEALSRTGVRILTDKAGLDENTSRSLQKLTEGLGGLLPQKQ